jgi:hypothetical protein
MATSSTSKEDQKVDVNQANSTCPVDWDNHGWCYMLVRIGFFLWVLNYPIILLFFNVYFLFVLTIRCHYFQNLRCDRNFCFFEGCSA